eukprot:Rhum_TRINITY_DN2358_c0_g2::Rhum_TRINITY_DN2358_c0_g2_i1::g.6841::m.6841/K11270/CTF8; chromosome transmission fidelity protein 8
MIIRITDDEGRGADEWDLVELQGRFKSLDGGSVAGKVLGQLRYTTGGGKISLQVGNKILEGDLKNIAKPYVLLEKVKRGTKRKFAEVEGGAVPGEGAAEEVVAEGEAKEGVEVEAHVEETSYKVVGVVKRQFILRTSRHYPPTALNINKDDLEEAKALTKARDAASPRRARNSNGSSATNANGTAKANSP